MPTYSLVQLLSCFAAAAMASAIFARDPDQRANRLLAMVMVCAAWWSLCEVLWNASSDPAQVVWLVRLSSLGWVMMGPLALHTYVEVEGDSRSWTRRLLRPAYAAAVLGAATYLATPWCITGAVPTSWGWGIEFGPLFWAAYLPTMGCVTLVLARWPSFFSRNVSSSERGLAKAMFVGISVPVTAGSITDVLLPQLGIQVPRLGSMSVLALGAVVGWSMTRNGYFLLAPGAFAREILEALRDGVALLRVDGRIRSGNDALEELSGRRAGELAGVPVAELLPVLAQRGSDELTGLETQLVRADGERIPVSVSSAHLCDESGERVGRVLTIRDMREVAALRSRLVTAGRLAAVGELAAGIAHEINNPVTFVRSNLVHLHRQWATLAEESASSKPDEALDPVFSEGEELIQESVEGVDRITAIVRDVRAFSHAGMGRLELADLNELVENTANVAALRYSVSVERCYGDLPLVRCAPHQLRQIFLNLLLNALQAVGASGRIRLVTQAVRQREWVSVRVEDDGCGIPADVIDRIFDPFFTTRPVGEGTGLGLALCYQIVRNHGGEIRVESTVGAGTTFHVLLPAVPPSGD